MHACMYLFLLTVAEQSKSTELQFDFEDFDFTTKSAWTDLQLKVEDKTLWVPKSFLIVVSPVFRRMYESDFKERKTLVLPLPGKKYEDVLEFLKCTITAAMTYDIVLQVLPLAHEYQVKHLLMECKYFLLRELDSIPKSCVKDSYDTRKTKDYVIKYSKICVMADKYGFSDLIEKCVEAFSVVNCNYYKDLPDFHKISKDVQNKILLGRLTQVEKKCGF
ncbi:hypothetical protein ACJMK2_028246 [Sinanodonta woodiana]|uniref:BTB domain-containing protein n=1 Tax=Sinanodonta woodiana TaxID=1069815 RepID=A0ABD3X6H8_SINWO